MAKTYELLLALAEGSNEEAQKGLIKSVESAIQKAKGELAQTEEWGKRTLAFPIKKSKIGYYFLVNFSGDETLPRILTDILRIEDSVLRFIIAEKAKPPKAKKSKKASVKVKKLDELVVR